MLAYNHERYISKAIEGVLSQDTDFPFELVIGEDNSVDGTREKVRDYQRKYPNVIRVVTSSKNVGMQANWWRTMKACLGKYIAFCEGDDCWHAAHKLRVQAEYMESHESCGLVYSDYDLFDTLQETLTPRVQAGLRPFPSKPVRIDDVITGDAGILTCTVLARRALVEKVINEDHYLHRNGPFLMGDTQIWAEMSMLSELHYLDESLATYNVLVESASRSKDFARQIKFWKSGCELRMYLCKKHALPTELLRAYEADWRRKSLHLAALEKRPDSAEQIRLASSEFTLKNWLWYLGARLPQAGGLLRVILERKYGRRKH